LRGRSPRSNRNIQRWAVRILIRCSPPDVEVFRFRAPALPAQRILGGGFRRGAKPPSEWNVQRVRLACGRRAPPCSWTLLIALARAFLRQAPRSLERRVPCSACAAGLRARPHQLDGRHRSGVARRVPCPGSRILTAGWLIPDTSGADRVRPRGSGGAHSEATSRSRKRWPSQHPRGTAVANDGRVPRHGLAAAFASVALTGGTEARVRSRRRVVLLPGPAAGYREAWRRRLSVANESQEARRTC